MPTCARCGSTSGRLGAGGLCPVCLLAACLESEGWAGGDADGDTDWLVGGERAVLGGAAGAGRRLGDYELLAEIGRGAMGVVYRARQLSLNRWVAVKCLLAGPLASVEAIQRFEVEAAAAAVLQHPGIVAIHEVGVHAGQRYLVMDYVEGRSLAQIMTEAGRGMRDIQRCIRWMKAIAEAVDHAHEHGILHRDLKPSNVMIDALDRPRVTDFGLAKRIGTESSLTLSGQVVGSPGYLPPEQAGGTGRGVSRASDVYSLGAMMYHLLTGRPPFVGGCAVEVVTQVIDREPVDPRLVQPRVPRDLATICLRCLEKEPGRRYGTARELGEELGRYLADEPIRARPVGWVGRGWRWCHRKPVLAGVAGLLVVSIFLGAAGIVWQWNRTRVTAVRESLERARAERTVRRLRLGMARDLFEARDGAAGLTMLGAMLREDPSDRGVAEWLMAELTYRSWPWPVLPPLGHEQPVHYAEFSPDGRSVLTLALDNTARLWNVETGGSMGYPLAHDRGPGFDPEGFAGGLKCLRGRFSPDGTRVATASVDNTARMWDAHTGEALGAPLVHPDWVVVVEFDPRGRWLATGCRDGEVRLWEVQTGDRVGTGFRHEKWVNFVEFDRDARRVVTGSDDGSAQVWNVGTGEPVGQRLRHGGWVRTGQFSPDGRRVATGSADGTARLWDAVTGIAVSPPLHHDGVVSCVSFSPDGVWLATASFDHTVRLWDAETGAAVGRPLEHGGSVRSIEFSRDGRRLLTAAEDKTVHLWDFRQGKPAAEPIRHAGAVWSARFSPDCQRVVTASSDGACGVWDVRPRAAPVLECRGDREVRAICWSGDGLHLIAGAAQPRLLVRSNGWSWVAGLSSDGACNSAEFSADGKWVVTASEDGFVRIWETETGLVRRRVRHTGGVVSAVFSGDGARILSASADGTAAVWLRETGELLFMLNHGVPVRRALFSPGSRYILTLDTDERVRIWEGAGGRSLGSWSPHTGKVLAVRFSPGGERVVTCSQDRTARLWDVISTRPVGDPLVHRAGVRAAEFAPDGRKLVTASEDNTAVIWDVDTGTRDGVVLSHVGAVYAAHFSPDGQRVVTASQDGTARLWDALTGEALCSPLAFKSPVRDAVFSPAGEWLAIGSGRSVWLWSVPQAGAIASEALTDLAEAVGGSATESTDGARGAASPAALFELRERMRGLAGGVEGEGGWLGWFLADPATRPVVPGCGWTMAEALAAEEVKADSGDVPSGCLVEPLLALHPTSGWLQAHAARSVLEQFALRGDPRLLREARWLADFAVALQAEHAAVWWVLASCLHYAADEVGTLEAIARAGRWPHATRRLALAHAQWLEAQWRENKCGPEEVLEAYRRSVIEGGKGDVLNATDRCLAWLGCYRLQVALGNRAAARVARQCAYDLSLPLRSANASARMVDLSDHYTARLDADWRHSRFPGHGLGRVPRGVSCLAGVEFDIQGLVQLSSRLLAARGLAYPERVAGIRVDQVCRALHFLHAADQVVEPGGTAAIYTVHWDDGQFAEIPIRYGFEGLSWEWNPGDGTPEAAKAWEGRSPAGEECYLFLTTWRNSRPEVGVASIDLKSTMTSCGMFVVAITAEE
jgi:eukaryotic-like serine/threonine-protein kinase